MHIRTEVRESGTRHQFFHVIVFDVEFFHDLRSRSGFVTSSNDQNVVFEVLMGNFYGSLGVGPFAEDYYFAFLLPADMMHQMDKVAYEKRSGCLICKRSIKWTSILNSLEQ